ncbi:hypothetical protein [Nonomuraea mesophila]|nr:hypothetical protein [Nonomuraea mesophila]
MELAGRQLLTEATGIAVFFAAPELSAQRADTATLLADAEGRDWGEEAARHRRLLERLDQHMTQTEAS